MAVNMRNVVAWRERRNATLANAETSVTRGKRVNEINSSSPIGNILCRGELFHMAKHQRINGTSSSLYHQAACHVAEA